MAPAATDSRVTRLADVVPFRGLRYNPGTVPDLAPVISPPYDIISAGEQKRYHDRHPLNAIRLDFDIMLPEDDAANNRYTRAAASLGQWIADKSLLPETSPAFYLCREEFLLGDGSTGIREGFFALVRLAEFSEGVVLPHEETASGPKADRLRLMQATGANLSAIYCLYSDPGHAVIETLKKSRTEKPDIFLTDDAGTNHSLWVVDDPGTTAAVNAVFADKTLLIADGHHRYETALAYRNERRTEEGANTKGDMPYDFLMVYLSDMDNTGKSILPIHRFVSGLGGDTIEEMIPALSKKFELLEIKGSDGSGKPGEDKSSTDERQQQMIKMMSQANHDHNIFGMYLPGNDSYYLLTGRTARPMIGSEENPKSEPYRSLDVAVLDRLILAEALGIHAGGVNENARVRFVERTEKAFSEVASHGLDVAFFLNPAGMQDIKEVAEAGDKMPQKSTYFYPKPVTGLVFRSFRF